MPDAEAPKSPELDLVAFGERLRDPVEDGVDDGLGFLLGEARQARQRLDQAGFRHGRALEDTVSVGTGRTRAHERPAELVQVTGGRCQSAFGSSPGGGGLEIAPPLRATSAVEDDLDVRVVSERPFEMVVVARVVPRDDEQKPRQSSLLARGQGANAAPAIELFLRISQLLPGANF